jgi:hypothetical protein
MKTMTAAEFREQQAQPKRSKFFAKPVEKCPYCKFRHPSQMEAAYCAELHLQMGSGEILKYEVHPMVMVVPGIHYRPDFAVWDHLPNAPFHSVEYIEIKGKVTEGFPRVRELFDQNHPAAPLRVLRGKQRKNGTWEWKSL